MSVSTAPEIIDSLRTEFIREATNAPKLFKDLAKVEHYIAESYRACCTNQILPFDRLRANGACAEIIELFTVHAELVEA